VSGLLESPASVPLSDGVRLRIDPEDTAEVVVRVRRRRSGSSAFGAPDRRDETGDDAFVLVLVSTNDPDDFRIQVLLARLAQDIRDAFSGNTRLHYPQ
jgi:hypothetical protein